MSELQASQELSDCHIDADDNTVHRRKKARCPGDRPECGFCVRLGQPCSYSDDEGPAQTQAPGRRNETPNAADQVFTTSTLHSFPLIFS